MSEQKNFKVNIDKIKEINKLINIKVNPYAIKNLENDNRGKDSKIKIYNINIKFKFEI